MFKKKKKKGFLGGGFSKVKVLTTQCPLCADSISENRLVSEIFTLQRDPIWA